MDNNKPLAILHVLRAPVGGLFRHVVDLVRGQAARGHRVGMVADATTGGERAEATLEALKPVLALGLARLPMSRHLGASDFSAVRRVRQLIQETGTDIVHGHGAKGGAYARLTGGRALRAYTPHGGTLHFSPRSPLGFVYLNLERLLMPRTDLILFESAFALDQFHARIGRPAAVERVVHNGLTGSEFAPVTPAADASDIVFVGELRTLKGVDVLIEALALLARSGTPVTATIVGSGPDASTFAALATSSGLLNQVKFPGAMPARQAFAMGRLLVLPSRAESLPYIVLEGAAAGLPMLTTNVGGIPEIVGPDAARLLPPGDAPALAQAIRLWFADPAAGRIAAEALRERIRAHFSADVMTDAVLAAYQAGINQHG